MNIYRSHKTRGNKWKAYLKSFTKELSTPTQELGKLNWWAEQYLFAAEGMERGEIELGRKVG